MQAAVALVAELPGRFVTNRAVRPDRVVLAPEPLPFLLRVRRRLELLHLQELIPEPAVKRLDKAVFPRPPGCHRQRFRSLARQPVPQRRANELRAVVTADPPGRPPAA